MKRAIIIVLLLGTLHFMASLAIVSVGFGYAAMRMDDKNERERQRMDREVEPVTTFERFTNFIFFALMFPLLLFHFVGEGGNAWFPESGVSQFAPFVLNSILWSIIFYTLFHFARRTINKRSTENGNRHIDSQT